MNLRAMLSGLFATSLVVTACAEPDVTQPTDDLQLQARAVPSAAAARVIETVDLPPHPESALHNAHADAYLVSNLGTNTGPDPFSHLFDEDDNGFISRVELNPNGTVATVIEHWIGAQATDPVFEADVDGITGITIQNSSLYAVDRDEIFVFDLEDPSNFSSINLPPDAVSVSGAGLDLPNDIIVRTDGTIYLTDTSLNAAAGRELNDAVYRRDATSGAWTVLVGGGAGTSDFGCPNGVDLDGSDAVLFLTFCSNRVMRATDPGGVLTTFVTVEGPATGVGRLDGLVRRGSGTLVFSDWRVPQGAVGALRWVNPNATVERVILDGLSLPADIGFDAKRQRVLIPSDGDQQLKIVRGGG